MEVDGESSDRSSEEGANGELRTELAAKRAHFKQLRSLPEGTRALPAFEAQIGELESDITSLEQRLRGSRPVCDQIQGKIRYLATLECSRDAVERKLEELQQQQQGLLVAEAQLRDKPGLAVARVDVAKGELAGLKDRRVVDSVEKRSWEPPSPLAALDVPAAPASLVPAPVGALQLASASASTLTQQQQEHVEIAVAKAVADAQEHR